MSIAGIVVISIVLVALALVLDRAKKRVPPISKPDRISANEAEPTQTGKFRVQQMMMTTQGRRSDPGSDPSAEEEDAPLPDPLKKG